MTRTTVLSLAAAFGLATTLVAAQSTTSTATSQRYNSNDKNEVTVTGCLSKDASGGYMLTNAREDKAGTTTGTTGTTSTTESSRMSDRGTTFKLEGGSDLDRHVGHKIAVTGKTEWKSGMSTSNPPKTSTTTGTTGSAASTTSDANHPQLDVTSVKMISSSCS